MGKKKKRRSMGKASSKNRQSRKSGKKYLNLPDGFSIFKEDAGETVKLDILPFVVGNPKIHPDAMDIPEDIWWKMPYQIHRDIGPENSMAICPGTIGKPCPICEEKQAIWDDPDGDDDLAKALNASRRGLYAIRPVSGKHKGKIMIWDISNFCFLDQLDIELENGEEEWNGFADLEEGYTLKIRFKEEKIGKNSKFAKANRIDFSEREDEDDDILEETPDLQTLIQIPSYEYMKALMEGEESEDEVNEGENELSKKKTTKKKTTKKKTTKKKTTKKKPEPEPEPDNRLDWDDLKDMDEDELLEVVSEEELELKDVYEDEDDLRQQIAEELEIEKPKKRPKKKKAADKKKGKKGKNKCPFGHVIGVDFEEQSDCDEDDCKAYNKCFDLYEELQE